MKRFWKDIKRYMPYAKYATKSGLKSEVASSHLSWLWWILDPILFMLVYWFIFMVRTEERVFSYLCFCRSVHVEPV